jgi:ribose 1,5-bisphosphokinase PhnN
MVIGAQSKRNVYLKFCTRGQDESNNCKYSIRRNHSNCCDVYYSLFNVLTQKMMKRGPNDLDEIIDRLKKENKRLKSKIKTLVNTKFVDKVLSCKESM